VKIVFLAIELQKSFNAQYIQNRARINMSLTDDSLEMILDNILTEYTSNGMKLKDSALNEEIRALIKAKLADVLLERLKSRVLERLGASKKIENQFEAAVFITWKKPFDLLDLLLNICLEVASEFNLEHGSETFSKPSYIQAALARQQANACLVFNAIIHLLKSGFPSGAHSHWKTLHEIACVSYFISNHGKDMAKRFLDYEIVERYFQVEAILEHEKKMDCKLLSERDFKAIMKKVNEMKKTYGSDFVRKANYPYGWVPRTILRTRSLKEIEKSVELDLLRPYYDLASYNVHGSPKGLIFKLGTMNKEAQNMVVPTGPSNYGLAEPGKSAAISLGQVTACLLLSKSSVKSLIIVEALRDLVDEICDAFCKIQAEFSKDTKT